MNLMHISLPDNTQHRLVYYLAMEEYVARNLDTLLPGQPSGEREAFFMWQVPPTVIFGRNQVIEAEVNIQYCQERGINLFRRKSGGGCVYADKGNIMLSYISDSTDVAFTFDRFLQNLALALRRIGLDAQRSGRNDVLVGGRKVSGNSFFLLPSSSIVHGTMLFDSDFSELQKAITPSAAKIQSKGVSSVRQRVTNVKAEIEALGDSGWKSLTDIESYKKYLLDFFCGGAEITLTPEQTAVIDGIEAEYLDPDFLWGRKHSFSTESKAELPGIGEITVQMDIEGETISSCRLSGDFFLLGESPDGELTARLRGCLNDLEHARKSLEGFELDKYVMGLTTELFLTLAYGNNK